MRDEDALRDVWYRHEEIRGKKQIDHWEPIGEEGIEKHLLKRRMKFIGKKLDEYFKTLPEAGYPEEMKAYVAQVISGEAELTEELEMVYNAVAMPTMEVVLK